MAYFGHECQAMVVVAVAAWVGRLLGTYNLFLASASACPKNW